MEKSTHQDWRELEDWISRVAGLPFCDEPFTDEFLEWTVPDITQAKSVSVMLARVWQRAQVPDAEELVESVFAPIFSDPDLPERYGLAADTLEKLIGLHIPQISVSADEFLRISADPVELFRLFAADFSQRVWSYYLSVLDLTVNPPVETTDHTAVSSPERPFTDPYSIRQEYGSGDFLEAVSHIENRQFPDDIYMKSAGFHKAYRAELTLRAGSVYSWQDIGSRLQNDDMGLYEALEEVRSEAHTVRTAALHLARYDRIIMRMPPLDSQSS